jgi:hypothetical protein
VSTTTVDKPVRTPEKAARLMRRRLRERNARFAALSTVEKRIKVAKDVIAQLNAKELSARSGCYINANIPHQAYYNADGTSKGDFGERDFREVLEETGARCDVCALGAMFVTTVKIRNEITTDKGRFSRGEDMHKYLADVFSKDQLRLIESAFEREAYRYQVDVDAHGNVIADDDETTPIEGKVDDQSSSLTDDDYDAATQFGWDNPGHNNISSTDERLRAIMNNIIANNGTFCP